MGWWLPSLICKRYKLCNHMVGRGQTSRQRVVLFCFVSRVNRRPCFCQTLVSIPWRWLSLCRVPAPGSACNKTSQPPYRAAASGRLQGRAAQK